MDTKIKACFSILILFLFFTATGLAQSLNVYHDNSIVNKLSFDVQNNFKDSLALLPERIALQIANEHVSAVTPIFFKAYLITDYQSKRDSKSSVLNLELLDDNGTLLKRQFHEITNGMVYGQMELPDNIALGNYSIKAYTRWSQNYGPDFVAQEKIQVGAIKSKESGANKVTIIPEGGTLLSGHENKIIIKIPQNRAHKSAQIERILDENKKEVAQVSFYSSGLGTAIISPMRDKVYQLELEDGTLFSIPMAEREGYLLQVNNLDENNAKIRIIASTGVLNQEVTLLGTSGGIGYFEKKLNFNHDKILDVELLKRNLPYGIFTLKLVDNLGTELASRPIWIDGERLHIDIKQIGLDSGATDFKTFKIKVTDHTNTPIKSQLSVSINRHVTDIDKSMDDNGFEHNSLFTFNGIKGENKILGDRKVSYLKDLDLLSSVTDSNTIFYGEDTNRDIKFSFQRGLEIFGHAYDLNNNLLSRTKIQVIATGKKDVWIGEVLTDAQGLLKLEDIQIDGNATLIARTKGEDVKSRLVKILPINTMDFEKNILIPFISKKQIQKGNQRTIISEPSNINTEENTIELEEVKVVEKNMKRKKYAPSLYGMDISSHRVSYQDFEKPISLGRLLSKFPGVVVSKAETLDPTVSIVGGYGPILWVLDGFPLSQGAGGPQTGAAFGSVSQSSMADIMALVNAQDIQRVELLKGPDAAIYGVRGSGGVFVIYTRSGKELDSISRKDSELIFEGYTTALDFNEYREDLSKRKEKNVDLIYWNPELETDDKGEATITIVLPSDFSNIKIKASTISDNGKIGSSSVID